MNHLRRFSIILIFSLLLNSCGCGSGSHVLSTATQISATVTTEYSITPLPSFQTIPAIPPAPTSISDIEIYNISVSPDGEMIALTESTGMQVYSLDNGNIMYTYDIEVSNQYQGQGDFSYIAWSPDSSNLAVGKPNTGVYIWDVSSWTILTEKDSKKKPTYEKPGFAWSPNGKQLALGVGEGEIVIWEKQTNKWVTKSNYTGLQVSLTWSLDDQLMVMDINGLYDVETGDLVRELNLIMDGGYAYALWSSDGKHMYAFYDLGGSVLNIENNKSEFSTCCYSEVAWSVNGRYFAATPESSNEVSVWDTVSDKLVMNENQGHIIYAFAWTPSNELLAVGLKNEKIMLWNTKTKENLFEIRP